jgi:hypothetical protein
VQAHLAAKWLPEYLTIIAAIPKGTTGKPARIGFAKAHNVPEMSLETTQIKIADGGSGTASYDSLALSSGEGKGAGSGQQPLEHFDGLRALLTVVIVLFHFCPRTPPNSLNSTFAVWIQRSFEREFGVLDLFAVLSGFSTHLSFATRDLVAEGLSVGIGPYFARLDRVIFTTVVSMLLTLLPFGHIDMSGKRLVLTGSNTTCSHGGDIYPEFSHQALCVITLGAVSSFDPGYMCRNLPVWFIGGMMPIWLAYPWLARGVRTITTTCGEWMLVLFAVFLWALCSYVPMMLVAELRTPPDTDIMGWSIIGWRPTLNANETRLNDAMSIVRWYHYFPTFYWVSFVVGICAAQLSSMHESAYVGESDLPPSMSSDLSSLFSHRRLRGLLADTCVLFMFVVVAVLHDSSFTSLDGVWQARGHHQWTLVHTAFLYGSAAGGGAGAWAYCLRHPILVSAGKYAFAAFLFQMFIAQCLDLWLVYFPYATADTSGNLVDVLYHHNFPLPLDVVSVVSLLPMLWTFAILYTVWFERPVVTWLRGLGNSCCAATGSSGDQAGKGPPEKVAKNV